jgi:hypothetical protein
MRSPLYNHFIVRLNKIRKINLIHTEPTALSTGGIPRCREGLGRSNLRRRGGSGGGSGLGIMFKLGRMARSDDDGCSLPCGR